MKPLQKSDIHVRHQNHEKYEKGSQGALIFYVEVLTSIHELHFAKGNQVRAQVPVR
jgi:hypothetical protein